MQESRSCLRGDSTSTEGHPAVTRQFRLCAAGLALSVASSETPASTASGSAPIPVYAYFYQWFNVSSWRRAKQDFPLAGRYCRDDAHVLRNQVLEAKAAGLDGFLTSWKSTDTLNRRLDLLVRVAKSENFDLGVVYQALDFARRPLPVATVQHDMEYLVDRWGGSLTSRYYGRPVIIWTGTDKFTTAEVHAVKNALGNGAYLLATSRSSQGTNGWPRSSTASRTTGPQPTPCRPRRR